MKNRLILFLFVWIIFMAFTITGHAQQQLIQEQVAQQRLDQQQLDQQQQQDQLQYQQLSHPNGYLFDGDYYRGYDEHIYSHRGYESRREELNYGGISGR